VKDRQTYRRIETIRQTIAIRPACRDISQRFCRRALWKKGDLPTENGGRMSTTREADLVIWGVTREGRPFRPSDWCDRLAGLVSVFGSDQRLAYSPLVRPVTVAGVRAVVVGRALADLEPRLYAFLAGFARDNELQSEEVEDALVASHRLVPPSPARPSGGGGEPREPV